MLRQNIVHYRELLGANPPVAEAELVRKLLDVAEADLAELEDASTPELARRDEELRRTANQAVGTAVALLEVQFGYLQVYSKPVDGLVLLAQLNFQANFLRHFARVSLGDGTTCSRCFATGKPVKADVEADAWFAPHREIAREAGFRSVLSLPLHNEDEAVIGVLSVHFSTARKLTDTDLHGAAGLARAVGRDVGRHLHPR